MTPDIRSHSATCEGAKRADRGMKPVKADREQRAEDRGGRQG